MCILFLYLNPNPKSNGYRMILANNREEDYNRPTDPASFWVEDGGSTIGGVDRTKEKDGGTWLAMNKNGKVAVLLNILQPKEEIKIDVEGRGFLVRDYVQGSEDPRSYLNKIRENANKYNGFLLVTLDIQKDVEAINGAYYTNVDNEPPQQLQLGRCLVFGNSSPSRLWEKAIRSRELFEEIVGKDPLTSNRDRLVQMLFQLLKDPTPYELNDHLLKQGKSFPMDYLKNVNRIFVTIPEMNCGTRSHTLILVDAQGKVEYIESSMKEPIVIQEDISWIDVQKYFQLQ